MKQQHFHMITGHVLMQYEKCPNMVVAVRLGYLKHS